MELKLHPEYVNDFFYVCESATDTSLNKITNVDWSRVQVKTTTNPDYEY